MSLLFRPAIAAAILQAALSAPVLAQNPQDDMAVAAMIEWTVGRCGVEGVSPFQVMMAQAVANGADPEQMERTRRHVADRINDQFPDQEAACREMKAYLAGG